MTDQRPTLPIRDDADKSDEDGSVSPPLDAEMQMRLGRVLESYCAEIVSEPVPEIFLVLLAKLEAKEREG